MTATDGRVTVTLGPEIEALEPLPAEEALLTLLRALPSGRASAKRGWMGDSVGLRIEFRQTLRAFHLDPKEYGL